MHIMEHFDERFKFCEIYPSLLVNLAHLQHLELFVSNFESYYT